MGSVEETPIADARAQMETNFFGVRRACQAAMPIMRGQSQGLIINISSLGGVQGLPFSGQYSATKFAVERNDGSSASGSSAVRDQGSTRRTWRCGTAHSGEARGQRIGRLTRGSKKPRTRMRRRPQIPSLLRNCLRRSSRVPNPTLRHSVGMFSQTMIIPLK